MEDNKQLALRIDGAVQSASQEVTNLRAELTATNRRLAELSGGGGPGPGPGAAAAAADAAAATMENHQLGAHGRDRAAPGAERRRASRRRPGPEVVAGRSVSPGAKSLGVVARPPLRPAWPPPLPCGELQAAVINGDPGAVGTGSHGHAGPAGGPLPAAESAL